MKKIIIGISGASGGIYAVRMLEILREIQDVETHLVVSPAGWMNIDVEMDISRKTLHGLADNVYKDSEIGAPIASGSFRTDGMIVVPCSAKTLANIANGNGGTLIARAADVCLKERRRLVMMVRETPLHLGHIRNMALATEIGAIIAPPLPAFYSKPKTITDMVDDTAASILNGFGVDVKKFLKPWPGMKD